MWLHGNWSGLLVALGAAALLDVLLLISFGWTELIGGSLRNILWSIFVAAWVAAIFWSRRRCRRQVVVESLERKEDSFHEALDHYLKGDNYQAEQILEGLLRRNVRDLDARLMLATLLRRDKRLDEATEHLDMLGRFEGGEKWELEIQQERDLLAEARSGQASAA
jgi:type VI protein secretion system component VasK